MKRIGDIFAVTFASTVSFSIGFGMGIFFLEQPIPAIEAIGVALFFASPLWVGFRLGEMNNKIWR